MAKTGQRDEPIQALLKEGRKFPPPKEFTRPARLKSPAIYKEPKANPLRFWEKQAKELRWMKPWKQTQAWQPSYAEWFVRGKPNVSDNWLDRHGGGPPRNKAPCI